MAEYKVSYTISATISGEKVFKLGNVDASVAEGLFNRIADRDPGTLVDDNAMRTLVDGGQAGIEFIVDLIEEVSDGDV